jgi:hypothetical protein
MRRYATFYGRRCKCSSLTIILAIMIMTWIVLWRSAISKQDHLVAHGQS